MRGGAMWCWMLGGARVVAPSWHLAAAAAVGAGQSEATPPAPLASGPAGAGLALAQGQVARQEYHASRNARGLQAPNRAHNLRAYFEPEGLRLTDRTARGEPELLELRLSALGRAGALQAVPAGEVASVADRVEIRRPG